MTPHRYDLDRNTGDYFCPTINNGDRKNETDFICEPDSYITSIENIDRPAPHNVVYSTGQDVVGGRITGFKLKKARAVAILTGNVEMPFNQLSRIIQPVINNTNNEDMVKPVKPAPSRSAAAKTAAAPKLAIQNPFEDLETKMLKLTPIRLAKFFKKNLPSTLEEFLITFFKVYNDEHATIYVESKKEQTSVSRRRSLGDTFLICKYYYPECNLYDVAKLLFDVLPKKVNGFRSSYCGTIKKRVWYYQEGAKNFFEENTDEYGNDVKFYKSKLK